MESYKRIYAVSVFLLCFFLYLCPQDIGGNYRIIRTWLNASGTESRQEADFHDGLGRPFQRAVSGMNTSGRFIHTFQEYDPKGRVCARWVPTVGSDSLVCLSYRDFKSASFSCHSDSVAVNRISYDIFDRETGCTPPGSEWSRNGKRKSTRYVSNRLNSVKRYEAPLGEVSLVQSGCYEPGSLYGEERTDEDGLSITVYRDKCGRIVLERRGENNDTYYVYNLLGQLRYVLSPQYQHSGY
ncbi:MAG: hypothetical protein IJ467_00710, partial [Bacteroidaceae bacterium]|nr:hypothetical protein [Bacteroidaceae bacterium]